MLQMNYKLKNRLSFNCYLHLMLYRKLLISMKKIVKFASRQCFYRCLGFAIFTSLFLWKFLIPQLPMVEQYRPFFYCTSCEAKFRKSLYIAVEMVNPAFAWQEVVLHVMPVKRNDGIQVGRSTFWARAVHKLEIIALDISHVGSDVYRASFTPTFAGLYTVDIMLTYINGEQFEHFSRHVRARYINVSGSPFQVFVWDRVQDRNITRYCTQLESGTEKGRWVKCGSIKGIDR